MMSSNVRPNKQPCAVCRDHKKGQPIKIRDDDGTLFEVSFICNCPYCERFLRENYEAEKGGAEK